MAAAAAGAAGGLLGGGLSWGASVTEGNKAWRRQKTLAQNAIRWRVRDMKAAGLNPVLAINPGAGASAPNVNMAQVPDFASSMARGADAAIGAVKGKASAEKDKTQAKTNVTQADVNNAQVAAVQAQADRTRAGVNTEIAQQEALRRQAEASAANAKVAEANEDIIRARQPEAESIGRLWSDPNWETIMRWKHIITGTGIGLPRINATPPTGRGRVLDRAPTNAPRLNPIPFRNKRMQR